MAVRGGGVGARHVPNGSTQPRPWALALPAPTQVAGAHLVRRMRSVRARLAGALLHPGSRDNPGRTRTVRGPTRPSVATSLKPQLTESGAQVEPPGLVVASRGPPPSSARFDRCQIPKVAAKPGDRLASRITHTRRGRWALSSALCANAGTAPRCSQWASA